MGLTNEADRHAISFEISEISEDITDHKRYNSDGFVHLICQTPDSIMTPTASVDYKFHRYMDSNWRKYFVL